MVDAQIPQSPKFAREQRRRALWAGVVGLVMGLATLALGIDSMRTGQWVTYGRQFSAPDLPGWVVTLLALFILICSAWILARFARKAAEQK
jgi:H+/Cl- antiporter ClcA